MLAGKHILITTVQSDSHTWNLIYIQLVLEELGATVTNLGSCVPIEESVSEIESCNADLVIVSSVNGHGYYQGMGLIKHAQNLLAGRLPPFVIGGKLSTNTKMDVFIESDLVSAGYNAVFLGDDAIASFKKYLSSMSNSTAAAL
ncbi:cobalamin B12-binding domain-containing protein [Marinobacter lacisalsi]|uniref:Cobalamin B12-binding domain-containing protein n=1 Tax=Marinobacter lacisalsi TaxID=475979 RepID=A0ABV8QCM1_9GAMM